MNRRNFLGLAAATAATPAIVAALGPVTHRPDEWVQLMDCDAWENTRTRRRVTSFEVYQAGKRHPAEL